MSTPRTRFGRTWAPLLVTLLLPQLAAAHDQIPGPAQSHPILLQGGDLYTVSDGVLAATDLLFADGEIVAIGHDLELPEGTEVIDVAGQRVYPGLIAMGTYLGLVEISAVHATDDMGEYSADLTPEVAAHTAFNYDSEILPTIRNHGITTVQVIPQTNLIRGRPFVTHLEGWSTEDAAVELFDGMLLGWPSVASGPDDEEAQAERRTLRTAFADAQAYLAAKRTDPDLPTDQRWEAMAPVLAGEQNTYIMANDYRQIVEAVAFAREFGLRMVLFGGRDAHLATDLLTAEEIPVLLMTPQSLPARQDDDYDLAYKTAALLDEAGVRFAIWGSPRGATAHRNLPFQAGHAVGFGLDPEVALRAITLTPAEILGIEDRQGSLEVGKRATLFVSGGDVMDYSTQDVTQVFIDGRAVDLDDRHREFERKYRTKLQRRQEATEKK